MIQKKEKNSKNREEREREILLPPVITWILFMNEIKTISGEWVMNYCFYSNLFKKELFSTHPNIPLGKFLKITLNDNSLVIWNNFFLSLSPSMWFGMTWLLYWLILLLYFHIYVKEHQPPHAKKIHSIFWIDWCCCQCVRLFNHIYSSLSLPLDISFFLTAQRVLGMVRVNRKNTRFNKILWGGG